MAISNKDNLNELISKSKKSWDGDVEVCMKNLRDDLIDKEEQKAIENFIKAMHEKYSKNK